MSGWTLRELVDEDFPRLAEVLNPWFQTYVDHLDYSTTLLDFLDRAVWAEGRIGVVAEKEGQLAGVAIGGMRKASFQGTALRSVNVTLVAVSPRIRRQGLASAMIEGFATVGGARGGDLVSLNTMEIYQSHKLYESSGFRLIERFQAPGAGIGEVVNVPGVREVDATIFARLRPPRAGRPGSILEALTFPPPPDHPAVTVRWFAGGRAGVSTAVWPVRLRVNGEHQLIKSCQILDAFGSGMDLDATMSTALYSAKAEGCEGVYQLPCVPALASGFSTQGGGWTLRYARGLTEAGKAAVAAAKAYDEVCPAP